jgi:hypothetical protein
MNNFRSQRWLSLVCLALSIWSSTLAADSNWTVKKYFKGISPAGLNSIEKYPIGNSVVLVNYGDSTIRKFDICSSQEDIVFQRPGPDTYIPIMAISPRGNYVVTNDPLSRIFVFSGNGSGGTLKTIRFKPEEGWDLIPNAAAFNADETSLFVEYSGNIHEFSVPEFKPVRTYPSRVPNDAVMLHIGDDRISLLSQQRGLAQWKLGDASAALIRDELGPKQPMPFGAQIFDEFRVVYASENPHALNILNLNTALVETSFLGADRFLTAMRVNPQAREIYGISGTDLMIWKFDQPHHPDQLRLVRSNGEPAFARALAVIMPDLLMVGFGDSELVLLERNRAFAAICGG